MASLVADGGEAYPHKFQTTHQIPAYVEAFSSLADGERAESVEVAIAGRVMSKRIQGKLLFYDVQGDGGKVQVMSSMGDYVGDEDSFRATHNLLKRGDIVGFKGWPGKSKKGELSIFPRTLQLLSPCMHMLPTSQSGLKNQEVRYRQRYLDLILNNSTRTVFETRANIIKGIRRFLDERSFLEVRVYFTFYSCRLPVLPCLWICRCFLHHPRHSSFS